MTPESLLLSVILTFSLAAAQCNTSNDLYPLPELPSTASLSYLNASEIGVDTKSYSQWQSNTTKFSLHKRSEKEKLSRHLEGFIARLKSFILSTEFNFHKFEAAADSLDSHLREITASVINGECDKDMSQMLEFCSYMFNFMADACETLRHYDLVGTQDQHLLHFLVDFHVRTMTLFDSRGMADPRIPGIAFKVSRFSAVVRSVKKEFDGLKHIRFGMRRTFSKQYSRALETILMLERKFGLIVSMVFIGRIQYRPCL